MTHDEFLIQELKAASDALLTAYVTTMDDTQLDQAHEVAEDGWRRSEDALKKVGRHWIQEAGMVRQFPEPWR